MVEKSNYYNTKIEMIKKYFKHDQLFLELIMLNYDSYNLYIRIDYIKKIGSYKLSWFDLDVVDSNIEKYISFAYISELLIYEIKNLCVEHGSLNYENVVNMEGYVELYIATNTRKENEVRVKFNKYIPYDLAYLSAVFIIIFGSLPKMLEEFLYELHALINDTISKYEFKNSLKIDLEHSDLTTIFAMEELDKGEDLYQENRVSFLEKIDNKYYGVIEDNEQYLIVLEKINTEEYKVYCSCPQDCLCPHLYCVIKSIQEKKFQPFYKVMFKMGDDNLLEKIMSFNYFLCLGTDGKNILIVDNYGDITKMPIFNFDGEVMWEIISDSEDKILEKAFRRE